MISQSVIIWDFDGVILNSNKIRDFGFEKVLKDYPKNEVQQLMSFHKKNGGLSRYVKFRYFFEEIRLEKISEDEVQMWADKFSKVMLSLLIDEKLLINETLNYIKGNFKKKTMHIVSASDQNELRKICSGLNLTPFFKSISGSPVTKKCNVKNVIELNSYKKEEVLLIGDSINDYHAAKDNGIGFSGYNNLELEYLNNYIYKFY